MKKTFKSCNCKFTIIQTTTTQKMCISWIFSNTGEAVPPNGVKIGQRKANRAYQKSLLKCENETFSRNTMNKLNSVRLSIVLR